MTTLQSKTVMIVEDDKVIRDCSVHIVNSSDSYSVVGSYGSGEDALARLDNDVPDFVLMDINLPGMNGIECTRLIKERFPDTTIIMVTASQDCDLVFGALKAGASGYITKGVNYRELLAGLDEIRNGGAPISSKIAKMVIDSFHVNLNSSLTRREQEILKLISEGKTYTQISEELFISKYTTKTHIRHIYKKLEVNRKSDAIDIANQQKLI